MAKRETRFLENSANANRVLLFAVVTAPQKALARFGVRHLVHVDTPAMHTARGTAPVKLFSSCVADGLNDDLCDVASAWLDLPLYLSSALL